MSKQPFRHLNWEVVEGPRAWRVRNARSGRVFQVMIDRVGRRREMGACSCGSKATTNPYDHCEHQRAAFELVGKQWFQGQFGAKAYQAQQERVRLFEALRSENRRGYIECPHCQSKITADDLRPDQVARLQPKPNQPAFPFDQPGGAA